MRPKLTYANVISTLCFFLLLSGGVAFAASHLGKNSVGSKQLKKNAVTTEKIKKEAVITAKIGSGAVNGAKIQDGSLTGSDVQDGSLTGTDINQGSLNNVRAANVTSMAFTSSCSPALPLPSGVTSSQQGSACQVTFPNPITDCTASATVHFRPTGPLLVLIKPRTAQIFTSFTKPNLLAIDTYEGDTVTHLPFDLVLVC